MNISKCPKSFIYVTATIFLIASKPSFSVEIEEIIVTATKRQESAQQVGLSVTAMNEEDYREITSGLLGSLTSQLTNVESYVTNSFLESVHIRGIGLNEFQGQYDSPVAQHMDEVYISKPWMVSRPRFDIERVEVLKGPQGTLFGRNTTGGAVNYYTVSPSSEHYSAFDLSYDEYNRGNLIGVFNGGLSDNMSGRFSFRRDFGSGGPQTNLYDGKKHGAPDLFEGRAQLSWQENNLKIRGLVHGGRDKSEKNASKGPGIFNFGAPGYCPELLAGTVSTHPSACAKFGGLATFNGSPEGEYEPEDIFTINQDTPDVVNDTFYGGYLRAELDSEYLTFISISAYEYYERIHEEDSPSDIFAAANSHYYDKINQYSQEFRLLGELSSTTNYLLGFYFESNSLAQSDGTDLSGEPLPGITPPFADQFFTRFNIDVESLAVFGNLDFSLSDDLSINLSARYTDDSIEAKNAMMGIGILPQTGKEKYVTPCLVTTFPAGPVGSPACPFLGPEAPLFNDKRKDNDTSFRFGAEWTPMSDFLVYANLSTGYRAGGYSLPFAGSATTFSPESVFAKEAGIKTMFNERSVQLNAAIFQYDFDDVQVNVDDPVSPLVPITRNIGKQKTSGAELDLEWRISEKLLLKQGVGYLDAKYSDTDRSISTYAGIIPLDGKRPVNSPEWTYHGLLQYQQSIDENLSTKWSVDYSWTDKRYLEATNQPFDEAGAYWLVNARVALKPNSNQWEAYLFTRNLFNEKYLTYVNNIPFFKLDMFGERRTFGVGFRVQL